MSYSNYEQTVIINGHKLNGVQDVDGSYGISEKPVNVAGVGFIDALPNSPLEGNFSISRKMVGKDPFLNTNSVGKYDFDEQEISGAILYDSNTKGFGFTKARVSRYSVNCAAGSIPDTQVDIKVYGNLGSNVLKVDPYAVNTSSEYYPFDGDYVYYTNVQGQVLDQEGSANLKDQWNTASLKLSDFTYNSLNARTRTIDDENVLALGKDAFIMNGYANLITEQEPEVQYPDQSSIKIKVSDFDIDAVSDFSFSRTVNLQPVYAIPKGQGDELIAQNLDPVQVDTQYPIETDINFTIIADQYEIREIKDRLQSAPRSSVEIEILDAQDQNNIINSFTGYNVRLISESINGSINEEMSVSLTFKGYESLHNQFYIS
jgi:hypothetical protein